MLNFVALCCIDVKIISSGEITILLNTFDDLKCYSGLILFGSNGVVKYSVAAACSLSLNKLIDKLVRELWQSYLFVYRSSLNNQSESKMDYYKHRFLQMNTKDTVELWGIENISEINNIENNLYSLEDLINSLNNVTKNIYYYSRITSDGMIFSKIISPDLFFHISTIHTKEVPNLCKSRYCIDEIRNIEIPFP